MVVFVVYFHGLINVPLFNTFFLVNSPYEVNALFLGTFCFIMRIYFYVDF